MIKIILVENIRENNPSDVVKLLKFTRKQMNEFDLLVVRDDRYFIVLQDKYASVITDKVFLMSDFIIVISPHLKDYNRLKGRFKSIMKMFQTISDLTSTELSLMKEYLKKGKL